MGRHKINRDVPKETPGKEDNVEIVENVVNTEKPKVEKQVLKPVIKGSVFNPDNVQEVFSVETISRSVMTFTAKNLDDARDKVKNHFSELEIETTVSGDVHPLPRSVKSQGFRMLESE